MQIVYVVLCIVGTVLPAAQVTPWLVDNGVNVPLLAQQALAMPISAFAWSDVVVSALVLVAFVLAEGRRLGMPHAWISLSGLIVGVSLALPLFLLLRERHLLVSGRGGAIGPSRLRASD